MPPFAGSKSALREYFESLLVAVVLALFVRTFVVQAFRIPSASMEPSLLVGDHLLVDKQVFSPSAGPLEAALLGKRRVARGDVAVFKFPEDPARDFVKRVIGLPGERVEIRAKAVWIDGRRLEEPWARFTAPPLSPHDPEYTLRSEHLRDDWGPATVPPGHLLVLGDNRDNSRDSRYWGFLREDQVKGRALVVYWSAAAHEDTDGSAGAWSFLPRVRRERLLHVIR